MPKKKLNVVVSNIPLAKDDNLSPTHECSLINPKLRSGWTIGPNLTRLDWPDLARLPM